MSIEYAYEVTKVDTDAKCMEVVYTAEGYDSITVGTMLPYDDEPLENVIKAYAPIRQWIDSKRSFAQIVIGTSGAIKTSNSAEIGVLLEEELTPPTLE